AIPEEFLTTWSYDKQEGFDDYLASKGVPWVIRKLILISGHVIKFEKTEGNKWSADHNMGKRSSKYEFFLGEEFQAKGFDQAEHKILIVMDGDALVESHQRLDKPDDPAEIYTYTIENGRLVQAMRSGNVSCKRYFKKKN
ncbi:hypothetical protein PENTCL1PPCAC_6984, partial [Pristionchus entomophagus]